MRDQEHESIPALPAPLPIDDHEARYSAQQMRDYARAALAQQAIQATPVTHEPLTDDEKGDRWRELLPHSGDWSSADWFEAGACFAENAYRSVPSAVAAGTDEPKPVLYVRCIDGTYREAQAHER